ncbi:tail fiber domain-containing protein [Tichowtungia aerotolerans]|uniref:Peptidase S74 domain-containing protein n=1 Tax=Tichowtungia aerotolerans TaxID=2697043 RepID=A0A6P1MAE8_9BACT|nr:tail fiber domain-containing protein [Tichowtungia aerotolerans]QHI69524.1 hypothetical protein GT409_08665 [Tichowtungia aerotolerans]
MRKQIAVSGWAVLVGAGLVGADQLINDDLVVGSSLAIGTDAVNGENFGFDTVRLKENNLRIHFQDTSTSGSFPTRDWRIIINDSGNGGANYFAIEDSDAGRQVFRVEANAPSSSLYVEDSGQIGLGTDNPAEDLHIAAGDTPTIRLDQDGSAGWSRYLWDVAGNEANFFIRDVTGGGALPFRVFPGGTENNLVLRDGKVGVGLLSPNAMLHVEATNNAVGLIIGPSGTIASNTLHVAGSAYIGGTLTIASSRALKENIDPISTDEAMAAFAQLEPVYYNYIGDDETQLGFIAEDVPEIVASNGRNGLSPMDFSALLTRVVQEQGRREAELTAQVEAQSALIESLSTRLELLEQQNRGE